MGGPSHGNPNGEMERDDVCRQMVDVENGQDEDVMVHLKEGPKGRGPTMTRLTKHPKYPYLKVQHCQAYL